MKNSLMEKLTKGTLVPPTPRLTLVAINKINEHLGQHDYIVMETVPWLQFEKVNDLAIFTNHENLWHWYPNP